MFLHLGTLNQVFVPKSTIRTDRFDTGMSLVLIFRGLRVASATVFIFVISVVDRTYIEAFAFFETVELPDLAGLVEQSAVSKVSVPGSTVGTRWLSAGFTGGVVERSFRRTGTGVVIQEVSLVNLAVVDT